MPKVTIVSNRLPINVKKIDGKLEFDSSVGGLATGLAAFTANNKALWIGWPGIPNEELTEEDREEITRRLQAYSCYPVFLSKSEVDAYYNGYSNSVLWPLLHSSKIDLAEEEATWRIYKQVNLVFAEVVTTLNGSGNPVWVHDYQLMLLPELLRSLRPDSTVGFFLHTPFPNAKKFLKLPHAQQILKGVLGADLVGFHIGEYTGNFLEACSALGLGTIDEGGIVTKNRVVRITEFPIGIDYAKFADASSSKEIQKETKKLRAAYKGLKVILTVDRLDPAKGLVERLEAYREFLRSNPSLRGKVVMVMIVVPSRTDVLAYKKLKRKMEKLVEETNEEFKTQSWTPVDYKYTSYPFERLAPFYIVADIAFIAPLKDGMNLVAKEYVASNLKRKGVLILSKTAGAAQELKDAILVNPSSRASLVKALSRALDMPVPELRNRISRMQENLSKNNIQAWAGKFIKTLHGSDIDAKRTRGLRKRASGALIDDLALSSNKLIFLDYDGVLRQFVSDPKKAEPTKELKDLLNKLGSASTTDIVIISGRDRHTLGSWLGDLPVTLVAEHGAFIKKSGAKSWRRLVSLDLGWKKDVLPLLESFAQQTPGAFVEEKSHSLVWHYRRAATYQAQKNIVILKKLLVRVLRSSGATLFHGNKILEIKSPLVNKGNTAKNWRFEKFDFILAIGDDFTDEDMFAVLPQTAYTVKVGRGKTSARYRLSSVPEVLELLERLAGF